MATRIADYEGKVQGRCYRLWKENDMSWSVEKVWGCGANGVIFRSENRDESEVFLRETCRAVLVRARGNRMVKGEA